MPYGIDTEEKFRISIEALNLLISCSVVGMLPYNYESYIRHRYWKIRREIFVEYFGCCDVCKRSEKDGVVLQLHHLKYDNLRSEGPYGDVALTCRGCHAKAHKKI